MGGGIAHSHQCFNGRARGSICGGANCLGAVNGRNADGLGVLKGLLYDVLRASVRDQSPGRYPGGAGGIVSGSSTLHDRHRSRLCTRCTANFFDIRFHTCIVHLALSTVLESARKRETRPNRARNHNFLPVTDAPWSLYSFPNQAVFHSSISRGGCMHMFKKLSMAPTGGPARMMTLNSARSISPSLFVSAAAII